MEANKFTRRQALQATAVLSTVLLLPVKNIKAWVGKMMVWVV
jgi:hypothetical protein